MLTVGKSASRKSLPLVKVVDERTYLFRIRDGILLREEVWIRAGKVEKYNLAYINPRVCQSDNGRVLGYDHSHGHHHRHYMGEVEPFEFYGYSALQARFETEFRQLLKEGK